MVQPSLSHAVADHSKFGLFQNHLNSGHWLHSCLNPFKTGPFHNHPLSDHSKSRHVQISDPHFIYPHTNT